MGRITGKLPVNLLLSSVRMKARLVFAFVFFSACMAIAQTNPSGDSDPGAGLRQPGWNYGVWADYANGVGTRTGVHAAGAGLRIGRVLTNQHGSGWARGTFEYDIDLTPVEFYHLPAFTPIGATTATPAKNYYTGGFSPFIAKWNFTGGKVWVPYVAAEGGIVFSTSDLPQGNTANVNFTSGAAFGVQRFVSRKGAWTFQGKIYHLSNASLGPHNPGINAALQFKIGYTWLKP